MATSRFAQSFTACWWAGSLGEPDRSSQQSSFSAGGDQDRRGNIRINASRRSTVVVKAKGDVKTLGATATVHGHVLRIGSSSALRYFLQRSRIDLVLDVPTETEIDIEVFGADIVIDGGTGPLSVKGRAGAIEGTTYSDDVKVKFMVGADDLVRRGTGD